MAYTKPLTIDIHDIISEVNSYESLRYKKCSFQILNAAILILRGINGEQR